MPRGIYKRTPAIREAIRQARLGVGLSPETRRKISLKARQLASDPGWLEKVRKGTTAAMHQAGIRRRHLKGLRSAQKKNGLNFKGGNGQTPVAFVRSLDEILKPSGWVREYAIGIPGHKLLEAPPNYKVDFAHVEGKVAIECDGPCHRGRKELDQKKDRILKKFGWRIIRVKHD